MRIDKQKNGGAKRVLVSALVLCERKPRRKKKRFSTAVCAYIYIYIYSIYVCVAEISSVLIKNQTKTRSLLTYRQNRGGKDVHICI
jgi:hypothetical protein